MVYRLRRLPDNRRKLVGLCLLLLFLLACGTADRVTTEITLPTAPATGPATSTLLAIATSTEPVRPTVTLAVTPETALTPTASPVPCIYAYFFEPAPGGCPGGEPIVTAAAEQPFEGGVMLWLEATDSIYVLTSDQRWRRFDDTWSEAQPPDDPAIVPPEGYYQPVRGFGKIWREQPDVRQDLGWALGPELGFESTIQEQEPRGEPVLFVRVFNDQVLALTGRGTDEGDWAVAAA